MAQTGSADTSRSLLILHTNDIHDHLRADYNGIGGLPFVSGFVRSVRAERDNVLVMDAGDVAEKGELVARNVRGMTSSTLQLNPEKRDMDASRFDSDITFKAMRRVGYDVWAPGNHDHDFGIDALYRFTELAGMDIVCINLLKEDGTPEFPPSAVYEVNGIRIGVIGGIAPRSELSLNMEGTAQAMAEEATRLKPETDIIFGLVHISLDNSIEIARNAPDIDVIISGHSHQKTHQPVVVPETGGMVVQAGYYAHYVGWMELDVNVQDRRINSWDYKLVEMDHATIHPDLEMIEWVRKKELELAPEALKIVSWSPRVVSRVEIGVLAAEALRKGTGADIALHKTAHILRNIIPKGIHDVNAVYRSGGERGENLVMVDLTGEEIHSYFRALPLRGWHPTNWSGFWGSIEDGELSSDLDPERYYSVVMPEREWRQRFLRTIDRVERSPEDYPDVELSSRTFDTRHIETKWIDAVTELLEEFRRNNIALLDGVWSIAEETGQLQLLERYSQ